MRALKRSASFVLHHKVECSLDTFDGRTIALPVVEYHYAGASIDIRGLSSNEKIGEKGKIQFTVGGVAIGEPIWYELICAESETRVARISLHYPRVKNSNRSDDRFRLNQHISPTLMATDPLDPNRVLYFAVRDISRLGLGIESSRTNRHLLPGMVLKNGRLFIPNADHPVEIAGEIRNVGHSVNNDQFRVGVALQSPPSAYKTAFQKYFSVVAPETNDPGFIHRLKGAGFSGQAFKNSVTFREIREVHDYEDVLKLRYRGYRHHAKVAEQDGWTNQGEGLENEGRITGVYYGSRLVGSFEIRFGTENSNFRFLAGLSTSDKKKLEQVIPTRRIAEVCKLVIDPDYQRSDIVIAIIRKMSAAVVGHGDFDGVITATDRLSKLYEKIGFRKIGIEFLHPVISSQSLHVMRMPREAFIEADDISVLSWTFMFGDVHANMLELGSITRGKTSLIVRSKIATARALLRAKNSLNRSLIFRAIRRLTTGTSRQKEVIAKEFEKNFIELREEILVRALDKIEQSDSDGLETFWQSVRLVLNADLLLFFDYADGTISFRTGFGYEAHLQMLHDSRKTEDLNVSNCLRLLAENKQDIEFLDCRQLSDTKIRALASVFPERTEMTGCCLTVKDDKGEAIGVMIVAKDLDETQNQIDLGELRMLTKPLSKKLKRFRPGETANAPDYKTALAQ